MPKDFRKINQINVIDTCTAWNVLSSNLLFRTSISAHIYFSCTAYVKYEACEKPRSEELECDKNLIKFFCRAEQNGDIKVCSLSIADLQEIGILENRKRLGKGELSSIAFALRTHQSVMTDDKKARKLSEDVLGEKRTTTTPQLVGYLVFIGKLNDSDIKQIIEEHTKFRRPLCEYIHINYLKAMEYRLVELNN